MNKRELVDQIANKAGLTKKEAQAALDAFLEVTAQTLAKGEPVRLVGFGTFTVVKRAARTGRNPRTGKPLKIPARQVVKFRPSLKV